MDCYCKQTINKCIVLATFPPSILACFKNDRLQLCLTPISENASSITNCCTYFEDEGPHSWSKKVIYSYEMNCYALLKNLAWEMSYYTNHI